MDIYLFYVYIKSYNCENGIKIVFNINKKGY